MNWEDYHDNESGISNFAIMLMTGAGCTRPDVQADDSRFIQMSPNITEFIFRELNLQVGSHV